MNKDIRPFSTTHPLLNARAVRNKAYEILKATEEGQGLFKIDMSAWQKLVEFVLQVMEENYPGLKSIPFHSRRRHINAGGIERLEELKKLSQSNWVDKWEWARIQYDLLIPSVLLDAGAGATWRFEEKSLLQKWSRSEGLGVASYYLFKSGAFSQTGKNFLSQARGCRHFEKQKLLESFQVSAENPLLGVEGRVELIRSLGKALEDKTYFPHSRPGNLIDQFLKYEGESLSAERVLEWILWSLGSIWPSRLKDENGQALGDVWRHTKFGLVPFHKLSQWMTYSLLEPLMEVGITVENVSGLTGLPEYRNGGLFLDSGVLLPQLKNWQEKAWAVHEDFIIEWRALTVALLDRLATDIQKHLGKSSSEFPLACVLEGGSWSAGRKWAKQKRADGGPPFKIISDGTVF
jgi:hypothetical protein